MKHFYLLPPPRVKDLQAFTRQISKAVAAAEKRYGFLLVWEDVFPIESKDNSLPEGYEHCGWLNIDDAGLIIVEIAELVEEDRPVGERIN